MGFRAHPQTRRPAHRHLRKAPAQRDVQRSVEVAGQYRRTEKNIGVDQVRIAADLRQLLDDARFWVEHSTYPPDEIACRVKHRIVCIHCFANGNGRHSRLLADMMVQALGQALFTWGAYSEMPDVRERYFEALRKADRGDVQALIAFARS